MSESDLVARLRRTSQKWLNIGKIDGGQAEAADRIEELEAEIQQFRDVYGDAHVDQKLKLDQMVSDNQLAGLYDQEPLGKEFEKVLYENLPDLYEE